MELGKPFHTEETPTNQNRWEDDFLEYPDRSPCEMRRQAHYSISVIVIAGRGPSGK